MSPEIPLNERVAAIEPQLADLKDAVADLHLFKDIMIKEIAELTSTVKTLSWKISVATGAIVTLFNLLAQWGVKKFLP